MSAEIYCLVSQWIKLPVSNDWYPITIIGCSTSDTNRIVVADGWSPHDHGSVLSASEILTRVWHRQWMHDGRWMVEPEPPGWFERRCGALKCSWFPALARRVAAGESVTFEEIRAAYRTHNDGQEIPTGTWN